MDVPAYPKLMEFLDRKIRSCTPRSAARVKAGQSKQTRILPLQLRSSTSLQFFMYRRMTNSCLSPATELYQCTTFKAMGLEQKRLFNCLTTGHSIRACASQRSCKICGRRHYTLLHREETKSVSI